MSRIWNPPIPPIPASREEVDIEQFVMKNSAETFVSVLEGLYAYGIDEGDDKLMFLDAAARVAVYDPERGSNMVELMARNNDPRVRADVADIMLSLLGRRIERIEVVVWDCLLQDESDTVCSTIFDYLDGLLANNSRGTAFAWTDKIYSEVYDSTRWSEHVAHVLKLGRVRPRVDAFRIICDAT